MGSKQYKSHKHSLRSIIETEDNKKVQFKIPIYQRLYVWGDEQIKMLLQDVLEAHRNDVPIFIGTVVLNKHNESDDLVVYDLVDGQQRFTTLWLLGLLFSGDDRMGRFTSVDSSELNNPLRLTFSIRDEVRIFFNSLRNKIGQNNGKPFIDKLHRIKNHIAASQTVEETASDLHFYSDKRIDKIRNGLRVLTQVLLEAYQLLDIEEQQSFPSQLSSFVFEKIKFVTVNVPKAGDLNQLFETLNNRGVQLLQEDVVKAKLLNCISKEDRTLYNRLWIWSSVMDDYVENNLKGVIKSKEISDKLQEMYADDGKLNICLFEGYDDGNGENGSDNSTKLEEILSKEPENQKDTASDATESSKESKEESGPDAEVKSIVSFPQLLLHTLRIYDVIYNSERIEENHTFYSDIDEKRLIEIFQQRLDDKWKKDPTKIKSYIKLLWEVRFIFDNAIVKWVERGGDRELIIQTIKKSDEYLYRSYPEGDEKHQSLSKLQLLQRMLYHTQDPRKQNWLTPYLYKTLINQKEDIFFKEKNFQACFDLLEGIDNLMFCSRLQGDRKEQTYKLCMNGFEELIASEDLSFEGYKDILKKGLNTPHYWFYKIDLLLFIQKEELGGRIGNWEKFKMNSRNSIEHVLPRNAKKKIADTEHKESVINQWIGNLALVSTVDNATYNNGYFSEKKNKYKDINGDVPPSLKLDWMYRNEDWKINEIEKHHAEIEKLLEDYFDGFKLKY